MVYNNFLTTYIFLLPFIITFTTLFGIILWKKNFILVIISLELAFVGANIGFVLTSFYLDDAVGFIFSIISIALAGAEVALGLSLAILLYRKKGNINLKKLNYLKS